MVKQVWTGTKCTDLVQLQLSVLRLLPSPLQGLFGNPEALAFREPAQKQPLYR
jgi:hypothetical protein